MRNQMMFLCLLFASCSGLRVDYDYDTNADFSNYRTYNYYSDMQTGLSDLDTKRLLRALDSVLLSKGIQSSEEPDFLINIESREFQLPQNNSVGIGVGSGGRNVSGGVSIGVPLGSPNREREIIFDFIDSQKDALFWQAVTTSNYRENASPGTREKILNEIVGKVMKKYPPGK
ncbi:MAG: DUF4136 domain-containing protein [Eudoraea sp.]|nr:DUF4136 domain-containing protein [Eudoraea sp.]